MSRILFRAALLSILLGAPATAAEPAFFNAQVNPLGVPTPDLERALGALLENGKSPAWLAYTVPMVDGHRRLCCSGPAMCSLEGSDHFSSHRIDDADTGGELRILLRLHDRRVTEIRAFSTRCRLDAGGLPVYLWQDVEPRQSLQFLVERAQGSKRAVEGALVAIAYHGDSEADRLLESIARGEQVPRLEEEAIFWLGEARGTGGFEVLERLRQELRDPDLLEQIAFALHLSEADGALPALITMARQDPRSDVRGAALFWLSQQAGEQATAAIAEASEQDPDLDVKERAIFALSQLPPERGIPLLIRYARTHDSGEIRKKAMFWLGQTEDPRALDFFEEILTR